MQRILVYTAALVVLALSASAQQMVTVANPLDPAVAVKTVRSTANQDIAREACLALYKQIKEQSSRADEAQELGLLNGCLNEFPGLSGQHEAIAASLLR